MKIRKSILAGIVVSIVAYNYLLNHDLVSKIVFSVALIVILTMNLNLYTSKIATVCCSESCIKEKLKDVLIVLLGNALACMFFGYLFSFLGETHALEIWEAKLQLSLGQVIIRSILVGFLMQIAATCRHDLVTIGVVMIFITTGGEHSIANIAYMSIARAFSLRGFLHVFICLIGNAIGGITIYLLNKDDKYKLLRN